MIELRVSEMIELASLARTVVGSCDWANEGGDLIETDRRFAFLGAGCFATVYSFRDSDYVVKIGKKLDGAYHWLMECTRKSSLNPFMPRVLMIQRFAMGGYICVMERLQRLDEDDSDATLYCSADWMARTAGYDLARWWNLPYKYRHAGVGSLVDEAMEKCVEAIHVVMVVKGLARDKQLRVDMHAQNFMKRSAGQIVVTDPLV